MKRPTFFNGVLFAAIVSCVAGIALTVLSPLLGFWLLTDLLYPALALSYILYLRSCSCERVGWAFALAIWVCATVATWFFSPPLQVVLLVHLSAIWLVRSLYFYSSILASLADLGLTLFGTASALWVVAHTGSVFLSVWCFFLLQALFVVIPSALKGGKSEKSSPHKTRSDFERANQRAEAAINQLFAN